MEIPKKPKKPGRRSLDVITPRMRIIAAYLATGRSRREVADMFGLTVLMINKYMSMPKVQALIEKNVEKLEKGIINSAIVASFSSLTREGRIYTPPDPIPKNLSSTYVKRKNKIGRAAALQEKMKEESS